MIKVHEARYNALRVAIMQSREMIALYSRADQNRIQRGGMVRALRNWRAKHLQKRFTDVVRKEPFNYKWKDYRRRTKSERAPLQRRGIMAQAVYSGQAKASMRGGAVRGTLTMPPGHPLPTGSGKGWPKGAKPSRYRNEIQRVLTSLTPQEVEEVAQQFTEAIVGIVAAEQPVKRPRRRNFQPRSGQRRLTQTQRGSLS